MHQLTPSLSLAVLVKCELKLIDLLKRGQRRRLGRIAPTEPLSLIYSVRLHLTDQMLRRTGNQRRDIDLCSGQHVHCGCGELRGSLFVEQLTELSDFFLGQLAVSMRSFHAIHDRLFQFTYRDLRELDQFLLSAIHGIKLGCLSELRGQPCTEHTDQRNKKRCGDAAAPTVISVRAFAAPIAAAPTAIKAVPIAAPMPLRTPPSF